MPYREHDGSVYGRDRVSDGISIEVMDLPDGDQMFRFHWDGPVYQPFAGAWHSLKQNAIDEGVSWCDRKMARPDEDITSKWLTGVEHLPGVTCIEKDCPKPSAFDAYCARHYVLRIGSAMGLPFGQR